MRYYDTLSAGYDALYEEEQLKKFQALAKTIHFRGRVLDVGAGTCVVARQLRKKKNIHCVSVDSSKKMLDKGTGERHVAPAEHLPFSDHTFDVVVSLTALHHCAIKKALQEIKRVAKPGAIIALSFLQQSKKISRFRILFYQIFSQRREVDLGKDILFISQTC